MNETRLMRVHLLFVVSSPPLLRRDGPSKEYANLLNNHHDYLDRGGRMKVPQDSRSADSSPAHHPNKIPQTTHFNRSVVSQICPRLQIMIQNCLD